MWYFEYCLPNNRIKSSGSCFILEGMRLDGFGLSFTRVVVIYESCYHLRELLSFTEFVVVLLELLSFYGVYCWDGRCWVNLVDPLRGDWQRKI